MKVSYLWLIPVVPLISSVIIRLFGKRVLSRSWVHAIACGSVFVSFVLTLRGFFGLLGLAEENRILENAVFPWIRIQTFEVWVGFILDPLSSVMALVITGVGFLIHIYSMSYMGHDKDFERYFSYLNLFMAMMLVLVLADNLLLMFVGWEGVGLCSYLLIGFWFHVKENADAGRKAFVVNRIGDVGFIVGILMLFWALGIERSVWSLDFDVLRQHIHGEAFQNTFGISTLTLATLMLFVGATGKSAQIPLYVWLPDAMAGPTPVSALIHAATMVTAGVYMVARLSFLFDLTPWTLSVIGYVGAMTALVAASIAMVQNDIKKILAYSTVSQLGYMFLACGVRAYGAGVFHLVTHAFFKGLLFLGAGSVIHAMSGEQDVRRMGGLQSRIPLTYYTFLIGTAAIAGIPPLAGFFSKDEILWQAFRADRMLWGIGLLVALLTAFYMFRLLFLTFWKTSRASQEVQRLIHESPRSMTIPLTVLAGLCLVSGWLWVPGFMHVASILPKWLAPSIVLHHAAGNHGQEATVAATSLAMALVGIVGAYVFYCRNPSLANTVGEKISGAYKLLLNKYWVDELYDVLFVRRVKNLAAWVFWVDSKCVDGLVHVSGWFLRLWAWVQGTLDLLLVDGFVNLIGDQTMALARRVREIQTGQLQTYVSVMTFTLAVIGLAWLAKVVGF